MNKKRNNIRVAVLQTLTAIGGLTSTAWAADIDLNGIGYVQYGDAQSYSLPIACIQVGQAYPGCDFEVQSAPGQIADKIVIGTGSNNGPLNDNPAGMDDAYRTPDGNNSANFMTTLAVADPDGANEFTGDNADTWDAQISSLLNFLSGDQLVFFFNNNQLNGAQEQNLAAWAQITVTDYTGVPTQLGVFDFTNDNSPYALVSEGGGGTFLGDVTTYTSDGSGPDGNSNLDTDYVLSGGPICLNTGGAIPVPVSCSSPAADTGPINHNLGADRAAYAILVPELNELLDQLAGSGKNLDEIVLSMQFNLGCDPDLFGSDADADICDGGTDENGKNINNGFEQIFIGTAERRPPTDVPTPGTVLLIAGGLIALAWKHKRRLLY